MAESLPPARFNQVALSVTSRERSLAFYRDVIGFTHVGGTETFRGKTTERVQGMKGAASKVYWLMDDRPYFQLELFEFECPVGRDLARERVPQDIGHSRIRIAVPAIDAVICRATEETALEMRGVRVALIRDPDGILIELVEDATLGAPRLIGVALSVPDLAVARSSFVGGCGCTVLSETPEDWGALWGENHADKQSLLLDGGTITLELNCYSAPVSKPWPAGYQLADIGILNVALGFRKSHEIKARLAAMQAVGFKPNQPLVGAPGLFLLTYSNDPQGFSVETLMVSNLLMGGLGFRHGTAIDRGLMRFLAAVS
jgi:catechol 2,3-dioxygenase-like lactoylglutathione lyase family enzyme